LRAGSSALIRHSLLDEVDPRHLLGDGMLDLYPRVHLDEVEVALGIHEELDRPRVLVLGRLGGANGRLAHLLAQVGREEGGGRLLDELLVAPLD